jgi:hypothetical protein
MLPRVFDHRKKEESEGGFQIEAENFAFEELPFEV